MARKTILSLCDLTGNWPSFYAASGYDVVSIDLQSAGDVRLLKFPGKVHGILAAPPCTVFASSGARWPRSEDDMREGLSVVDACLRLVTVCEPEWWALENPIGTLRQYLGAPKMYFNPCAYGDPYTKKTCLWGKFNVPTKTPVAPTLGSRMHTQFGGKSQATKNARSATPMGFAKAFFLANP